MRRRLSRAQPLLAAVLALSFAPGLASSQSSDRQTARPPDRQTARPPDRQTARPPDRQTAPPTSSRQAYVYESWNVEDGLPVNGINALLQSRAGYIWAATWDGLVRFDGVRFTVFNSASAPELPSNRLITLSESQDTSLWMLTEEAQLVRFRQGRFTHIGPAAGLNAYAKTLYVATDGAVWVGTSKGLGRIKNGRFERVAEDVLPGEVLQLTERKDGSLLVASDQRGLIVLKDGKAERRSTGTALDTARVQYTLEDAAGRSWLVTSAGLWVDDGTLKPVQLNDQRLTGVSTLLLAERERAIYVFSRLGVVRVDENLNATLDRRAALEPGSRAQVDDRGTLWYISAGKLYRDGVLVDDLTERAELTSGITSFAIDREGSIWLATAASGLHRLKPALFRTLSRPEGLGSPHIYTIYHDPGGAIWVGGLFAAVNRISADGRITYHSLQRGPVIGASSFYSDRADRLLVGTLDGVLECGLPSVACAAAGLEGRPIFALHGDQRGRVWAGYGGGVAILENGRWTEVRSEWTPGARVRAFAETADAIWMGTNGQGVLRYADGQVTRIAMPDGLPSDLVRALYVDKDGWLWIGTEGRGLARLDPRAWTPGSGQPDRRIVRIGAANGLFDEGIHQILEDSAGRMWMNTNRGIFWVPRSELLAFADGRVRAVHSTSYTERDGIRNREGNGGYQPAGARSRDGRLWFPTQDGVAVVDPAQVTSNRVKPPVVIESVSAGDSTMVPGGTALRLGVDQRDLQIEYTALSFIEPGNVRFRYRLDPYDADWIDAGTRRSAFYTRVPPGRYTFRVIASNNEGVWNETGASQQLVLAYLPWETAGFRWLALLGLLFAVALVFRWRGRNLRMRAVELENVVALRTSEVRAREQQLAAQNEQLAAQAVQLQELDVAKSNFFANVSHEFRTPLTLTIGPLEDLQAGFSGENSTRRRSLDMALRNARRLLRLVNQILDVAKLDAAQMKLRPRTFDLVPFTRGVATAFDRVTEARGILLMLETPDSLTGTFDSDALEKILTNLLSNAVKFTPDGGRITVTLLEEQGSVVLRVHDTGPGISAEHLPHVFDRFYQVDETNARAQPGTGIGLSLVKELVKLHGGTIGVESKGANAGTTFTVRIPLVPMTPTVSVVTGGEVSQAMVEADIPAFDADGVKTEAKDDVATLLIVDDSADLRAYVREHFARRFRVVEAGSGDEGLALARKQLPDVIVSDVMMPGMHGDEMSRQLRASPETDFIPIILLTAQATTEQRITGLEQGVDDYLSKPFEMRELEARVDNLIAARKRLRARYAVPLPVPLPARGGELQPRDQAFIERVRAAIEAHLEDPSFGVAELASAVFQDRSHLFRRLNELVGESPSDLIRRVRLERACRLLADDAGTIAHVAYASGFNSVSAFSRAFRDAYGITPSEYRAGKPAL